MILQSQCEGDYYLQLPSLHVALRLFFTVRMATGKSLFGMMFVAHVALGCKWAPFDPHHVSSLQTQEVVSAAVQILARLDCKGTNGTLVGLADW